MWIAPPPGLQKSGCLPRLSGHSVCNHPQSDCRRPGKAASSRPPATKTDGCRPLTVPGRGFALRRETERLRDRVQDADAGAHEHQPVPVRQALMLPRLVRVSDETHALPAERVASLWPLRRLQFAGSSFARRSSLFSRSNSTTRCRCAALNTSPAASAPAARAAATSRDESRDHAHRERPADPTRTPISRPVRATPLGTSFDLTSSTQTLLYRRD
jgi:hypothetical protein